jgi:hypothetical protein
MPDSSWGVTMEKNIGNIDKVMRVILAIALAGIGYFYGLWWLYLIALVPLITAFVGYCALYSLFKINTK